MSEDETTRNQNEDEAAEDLQLTDDQADQVVGGRDPADGMATGRRQYTPPPIAP